MVRIVAFMVVDFRRSRRSRLQSFYRRSPCNRISTPLLQPFHHAEQLGGVDFGWLGAAYQQPAALRQECEQKKCGQNLGTAKAFARKKFTHEGTASVLPCPGTIGKLPRWTK